MKFSLCHVSDCACKHRCQRIRGSTAKIFRPPSLSFAEPRRLMATQGEFDHLTGQSTSDGVSTLIAQAQAQAQVS